MYFQHYAQFPEIMYRSPRVPPGRRVCGSLQLVDQARDGLRAIGDCHAHAGAALVCLRAKNLNQQQGDGRCETTAVTGARVPHSLFAPLRTLFRAPLHCTESSSSAAAASPLVLISGSCVERVSLWCVMFD